MIFSAQTSQRSKSTTEAFSASAITTKGNQVKLRILALLAITALLSGCFVEDKNRFELVAVPQIALVIKIDKKTGQSWYIKGTDVMTNKSTGWTPIGN